MKTNRTAAVVLTLGTVAIFGIVIAAATAQLRPTVEPPHKVLPAPLPRLRPVSLSEAEYVVAIAKQLPGSTIEARLFDDTRCDILWNGYAIEVDFGPKWAEGVGQALYYGRVLRRTPVVILIEPDERFVYRAMLSGGPAVEVWLWEDGKLKK